MHLPLAAVAAVATVLFSLLTVLRLSLIRFKSKTHFLFHSLGSAIAMLFIFQAGGWAYMYFWLRWVLAAAFLGMWVWKFLNLSRQANQSYRLPLRYIIPRSLFTLFLLALLVYFYMGGYPGRKPIPIAFPFKHGTFYVMQGGNSRLTNPAHRNFSMSRYGFAMDISALYPSGSRAKGLVPDDVHDYAIYGDTVVSPCDGTIILTQDKINDNPVGMYNTAHVHGNHVIIQASGYRVFMAHFIPGKVFVKEGMHVKAGDPIGLAGNSGFSAEPHLHLSVITKYDTVPYINGKHAGGWKPGRPYDDYRYSGISTPFTLDGRFLKMNDIIEKQ